MSGQYLLTVGGFFCFVFAEATYGTPSYATVQS
jgi:hypothetical protein